ncbi:MAG: XTP/dITP diphosphatase [Firmicutes bacterium]|jgi:XTP/dITP diphosphohydrolase|nr:XTP/dITP diphosphatase [Bacillota bacterium]
MTNQRRLVVASRNKHKVAEIRDMLQGLPFEVVSVSDLGDFPEVVEDGDTFADNARKKAVQVMRWTHELVVADDSGLEVDALDGAPGVHSARFAALDGGHASDAANNAKLLELLADVPPERRGAQFRCVIALAAPDGTVDFAEGICRGQIGFAPQGEHGFGYDPLFIVPEFGQTFAELPPEVKNRISHRAKAVEGLKALLRRYEKPAN